jgi:protoporphyrinogen oxidase
MTLDYVIIGGGISGVAMARLLQLRGIEKVRVLEADPDPGGLCKTTRVGPHIVDTGGGHFLCTKYGEVYDFIFSHLPKSNFNHYTRISKVAIHGQEVDYPIESNIWQFTPDLCQDYLNSILKSGEACGLPPPNDFESWIRWKLGNMISENYMLPYNRKIWGISPSEMDIDWLHKIPRINVDEIRLACASRRADRSKMPSHAGFFYPKHGGFQEIFDSILSPVSSWVETGVRVTEIDRDNDLLVVNGTWRTKKVINTVPWIALGSPSIFDAETLAAISQLRHNELVVSLHSKAYETKAHWVYEPSEAFAYHRSFYIQNFAPESDSNGFYRETNNKRWNPDTKSLFTKLNAFAYPIPALGWAKAIATILERLEKIGVYGLGRWGQWQYFNSDICIKEAMNLCARLEH